jgi:hypothetical protein
MAQFLAKSSVFRSAKRAFAIATEAPLLRFTEKLSSPRREPTQGFTLGCGPRDCSVGSFWLSVQGFERQARPLAASAPGHRFKPGGWA